MTRRRGRKGFRRAKTLAMKRLSREEVQEAMEIIDDLAHLRPKERGDCKNGYRPCPYVSCKYHLYLDINPHTGSIKLNFPDLEVWEMKETCSLDVAEYGGITLEQVGEILNLTRERIRQIEKDGLQKLLEALDSPPSKK